MFVSLTPVYVVYLVKEVASFQGARSINGHTQALQTSRNTATCSLHRN